MNIKHADIDDISGILPLLSDLGYPCELKDLNARFIKFLHNPGYGVAVCKVGEEIQGFVAWSKSYLFVLGKVRFHIEGIIVAEKFRGSGVGRKLMSFVEEIAKESGSNSTIIDLTSGLRRAGDGTHEFYKRLGYKNEGLMAKLYLRKEL